MAQLGPAIPIELVKTRLQVRFLKVLFKRLKPQVQRESAKLATEPGKQLYLGTMDCIKQVIKNEGVRGLFKVNVNKSAKLSGFLGRASLVSPRLHRLPLLYSGLRGISTNFEEDQLQ